MTKDRKQLKEISKRKKIVLKTLFSKKSRIPLPESEDISSDSELSDSGGSQTSSLSQENTFEDDMKPPPLVPMRASKPDPIGAYPHFVIFHQNQMKT